MRIAIMGAGALGSVLGALLSKKNDVILITRGEHLRAIREKGIVVKGITEGTFYLDALDYYPGGAELIIFTVKAYQTEGAMDMVKREYRGEKVITFQNGVGIVNMLSDFDVIPGVTTHGATMFAPGVVVHAGYGDTYIGEINGEMTSRVKGIAANFTRSGLRTEVVGDIMEKRVLKAAVNAVINPLTAITGVKNGAILEDENLNEIARCMAREINESLKVRGIEDDIYPLVEDVCRKTAENKSSMLQDIERKRKTEVDYILAPFIKGDCLNVVYRMVKFLEKKAKK